MAVELRQGDAVRQRTTSTANGDWKFENVPRGDYRVRMTLTGFVTTDLVVSIADVAPKPLLVTLKVGALSEEVIVQQGTPVVTGKQVPGGVLGGMVGGLPSAPPPPEASPAGGAGRGVGAGMGGGHVTTRIEGFLERNRDTASYAEIEENRFRRVADHPLSTFSVDVDTASYANVRRFLNDGRLPPADAVRIEELININRVILATDGDFNVGVTSREALMRMIEEKRERGIFLSVLGVGDNNLNDSTMEMLADKGNGNYSYLDSLQEGRRVTRSPLATRASYSSFPVRNSTQKMTGNLGFAAAVAQFGMLLRRSEFKGAATWQDALSLARSRRGNDPDGYRAELIRLIDLASALDVRQTTYTPELRR